MLFITNAVTSVKECEHAEQYPTEIYFGLAFPHIFALVDFSYWKAILVEVCNILTTFAWNFTDLFIILISCALAVRFKQIVKRLENNTVSML